MKAILSYLIIFFSIYFGSGIVKDHNVFIGIPLVMLGTLLLGDVVHKAYSK